MPGLVSTLLNQAYSTPGRLVQTFLQVTEQVWQPMHLSRFSTMPICARIFIVSLLLSQAWAPAVALPASSSIQSTRCILRTSTNSSLVQGPRLPEARARGRGPAHGYPPADQRRAVPRCPEGPAYSDPRGKPEDARGILPGAGDGRAAADSLDAGGQAPPHRLRDSGRACAGAAEQPAALSPAGRCVASAP